MTNFIKEFCKEKLLSLKITEESGTGDKYVVELIDTTGSSDISIASELTRLGLVSSPGCLPTPDMPRPLAEVSHSPPSHKFTSDFETVIVTEVESLSSIWVQFASPSLQQELMSLQASLESTCQSQQSSFSSFLPTIGDYCCTIFSQDQCWYRAQVVSISQEKVGVVFIDFGNKDSVQPASILPLSKEFSYLPQLAYHVSLSGVTTSASAKANKVFHELTQDKILCMKVTEECSPQPLSIQLYDISQRIDINVAEELVRLRVAFPDTGAKSLPVLPIVTQDYPTVMADTLGAVILPAAPEFRAFVTHIESPSKIFIQVLEKNFHTLKELVENINQFCETAPTISGRVRRGQLVLAPFEGEHFQAKLVGKNGQQYSVVFIDFGNKGEITRADIKPIPEELRTIPIQAVQCSLVGVTPHQQPKELMSLLNQQVTCSVVCYDTS